MVQKVQFSLKKTKYSLLLFICNGMNRLTEKASSINSLLAWLSWAFNTSDWTQMENLYTRFLTSSPSTKHLVLWTTGRHPNCSRHRRYQYFFSRSHTVSYFRRSPVMRDHKGHAFLTHPFLVMWIWATCESVNFSKLSRNFVWALRTTTGNSRASFIYFYLVFPINFTPYVHSNFTGLVLWYYHRAWATCGQICPSIELPTILLNLFVMFS